MYLYKVNEKYCLGTLSIDFKLDMKIWKYNWCNYYYLDHCMIYNLNYKVSNHHFRIYSIIKSYKEILKNKLL